jgi:hypothetical protein
VLYALGKLAGETQAHAQEINRLRQASERIPGQIIEALSPRLTAIEGDILLHDRRIHALEKRQWVWLGGGGVLIAIVGVAVQVIHPLSMR